MNPTDGLKLPEIMQCGFHGRHPIRYAERAARPLHKRPAQRGRPVFVGDGEPPERAEAYADSPAGETRGLAAARGGKRGCRRRTQTPTGFIGLHRWIKPRIRHFACRDRAAPSA
jgi:hypothetical protein